MQNPYDKTYQLAQEKFAGLDISDVAFNSSAQLADDILTVPFLGEQFLVAEKGKEIKSLTGNREVKIAEKILLIHYLTTADGTPLTRRLITFENLSEASFYYPTYKARTIDILLRTFDNNIKKFMGVSEQLGAKIETSLEKGKSTFLVLPNVPVIFIYWSGDREVPSNMQILYDANITHYLPQEDIVVITELLTHKIIRRAKEGKGSALYDYP
jgi:hypothetical protein